MFSSVGSTDGKVRIAEGVVVVVVGVVGVVVVEEEKQQEVNDVLVGDVLIHLLKEEQKEDIHLFQFQ